jgi:hypothetical protein
MLESFAKMIVDDATNRYALRGAAVREVDFFTMEHAYEFIGGHRVVLGRRSALPLVDPRRVSAAVPGMIPNDLMTTYLQGSGGAETVHSIKVRTFARRGFFPRSRSH